MIFIHPKQVFFLHLYINGLLVDILLKENKKLIEIENILNKGTDIIEILY